MIYLNIFTIILFIRCYTVNAISLWDEKAKLTINLPQGRIKGSYNFLYSQRMFLGIPYASVKERFQSPGEPPTWKGTFNANKKLIQCKQYVSIFKKSVGKENCLILNVFTPMYQKKRPLPVMVFIHGGSFDTYSSTELIYNPKYLVKEDVIVVTINYRLGAFGFLCLGLPEASGNMGIKDQIAALKWVQKNIEFFGGNPNSVTLFGQSVGAISASYLIFLPSAKGLFHRVILESGSLLSPHAINYNPIKSAREVGLRLGYNTTDPNELLRIFKNETADKIVAASYIDKKNNVLAHYLFTPCLESANNSNDPIITVKPQELIKETDMPLIIGTNNKEGIYWAQHYTPINSNKIMKYLDSIVPNNLIFEHETDKTALIEDIKNIYFKNATAQDGLIDYFTDSIIRYPVTALSEALIKNDNNIMYNYYFTYSSLRNFVKEMSLLLEVPGACHADELFYIFDPIFADLIPLNSKDRDIIANMVDFWTSFAKTGIPKAKNNNWIASKDILNYIELGETIKMVTLPHNDRIEFWKKTYTKYGRK